MKVVAFLQNPWSRYYAGGTWPRESWLRALALSRSGQKLEIFNAAIGEKNIWYDNTTPIVADNPTTILPPDTEHIKKILIDQEPKIILAFGMQAGVELRKIHGDIPLMILPHPTYRVVTNKLFHFAAKLAAEFDDLKCSPGEVVVFKQLRGQIEITSSQKNNCHP